MESGLPTALNEIFNGLDPETRAVAGTQLAEYVTTAVGEEPDDYDRLWNEYLIPCITRLAQTSEPDCFGALVAIDNLVQIQLAEVNEIVSNNLYRFYTLVKNLLPRQQAATSLGIIIRHGGVTFGDALIDFEVEAALNMLNQNERNRQFALMVLSELAKNSPGNFYKHVELVLHQIWVPLRDPRVRLWLVTVGLYSCANRIYRALLVRGQACSSSARGSLLGHSVHPRSRDQLPCCRATLDCNTRLAPGQYEPRHSHSWDFCLQRATQARRHEASGNILALRQHRDGMVRRSCIAILPDLAAYDSDLFSFQHMRGVITHLLAVTVKPTTPDERGLAFKVIGALAKALQTGIMSMMDKIVERIHEALTVYVKKTSPPVDPVFECIKKLAKALGPLFARHAQTLLDVMFSHPLTEGLKRAVDAIIHHCMVLASDIKGASDPGPPMKKMLILPTERLLQLLTMTLCQRRYEPLGSPEANTGTSPVADVKILQAQIALHGYERIALALHVLGTSDFAGDEVVRVCIIPYLAEEHAIVRQTAALTACTLIAVDPVCFQTSDYSVGILMNMLERLLTLAVADQAANDETFVNRELAVKHIGRLAALNPAYVIRRKEESAKLLTELITSTDTLITPYTIPILRCILSRAQEKNTIEVGSALMRCLWALATIGGEHISEFKSKIMDHVVRTLSDPLAVRQRRAALETLGALCSSTGYLVDPEYEHPKLVELITKVLTGEKNLETRREAMRALGIIGAVDQYKHAHNLDYEDDSNQEATVANHMDLTAAAADTNKEEYSSTVVFSSLVNILKTPSLSSSHQAAIEAIMSICKTQGLKILGYLPQVCINVFQEELLTRTQSTGHAQVYHLQQLGLLVGILGQHTRTYLPKILELVGELWGQSHILEPYIVALIENLARGFAAEFDQHIPAIIGPMLNIFEHDSPEKHQAAISRALQAIVVLAPGIDPALVLPAMLRTAERIDAPTTLRTAAISAVSRLAERCDLSDHASRIIHPLLRILSSSGNDLRLAVMDAICTLMQIFGHDFVVLVPTIEKCLQTYRISHPPFNNLAQKMLKNIPLPPYIPSDYLNDRLEPIAESVQLVVNQHHLRASWDTSQVSSTEDWREWIRRFAIECLKESPSHALRSCRTLADSYPPLLKDLFSISFFRCYFSLSEELRDELDKVLEDALEDTRNPADVCHMILNAAEFMEPLPIPLVTLSECALRTHAFAKALHWRELDFLSGASASGSVIESLILINTRLGQSDAAYGILTAARDQPDFVEHEQWYERLGKGEEAESSNTILGKMRCLHALGEWRQLEELTRREWTNATHHVRGKIAPLVSRIMEYEKSMLILCRRRQLQLGFIGHFRSGILWYVTLDENTADCAFYKAVQAVHRDRFPRAQEYVDKARELQDEELTALAEQNYGRSYSMVLRMQMLSEIEEEQLPSGMASSVMFDSLQQCRPEVEVWQRIVQLRTLVLLPKQDPTMWTKFANLCRKNDHRFLAERTFNSLLDERFWNSSTGASVAPPSVIYAHLKFLWSGENDFKPKTLEAMTRFIRDMSRDLGLDPEDPYAHIDELNTEPQLKDFSKLLAKCYLKRSQWMIELDPNWATSKPDIILSGYDLATKIAPDWYKGRSNLKANLRTEQLSPTVLAYILGAMQGGDISYPQLLSLTFVGFFRSIELRQKTSLQDSLRLLVSSTNDMVYSLLKHSTDHVVQIWFAYCKYRVVLGFIRAPDQMNQAVDKDMSEGISALPADTWLEVIPQIIARIQTSSTRIRRLINNLLLGVGQAHPQALIYPLSVASRSTSIARKQAAALILDRMRGQYNTLVDEALSISNELIRVAILWPEMWHEGLEEASRLYFTERDPEGMIAVLEPLHAQLEGSFLQAFGEQLAQAREHTRAYQAYGNLRELTAAWEVYVLQLAAMPVLDLQFASPILKRARNLRLAIPGSYAVGRPVVTIASFSSNLAIIASKQRPRRMTIYGSDGREYQFGLKGHEDLRQDERAMQLFGLVNTLLSQDPDSFKRALHIQRYPIIPLAPNVGLMGWVQQTETLHVLIRDYQTRRILLNIEYRLMLQASKKIVLFLNNQSHPSRSLTLIQKVEVFEYALDNTTGQDLYRILWLKSVNSEEWLDRRTTYTRSLAVTSMVGYILGLGDRHPSNLLIHRITGKIVHVDFGDCFEVAMNREKYPEKVPFRLTRMLTKAMEVSLGGSYRNTCVITMEVLRRNKDSLLAVLEAFVWDPLINWRLMQLAAAAAAAGAPSSVRGGQLRVGPLPPGANNETNAGQRTTIGAPSIPNRRVRADENVSIGLCSTERSGDVGPRQENRDQQALAVYNRVRDKLTGRDFQTKEPLPTMDQVVRLIEQATSVSGYENLCQSFSGWCAFW
ncbi:phosphatidylinositol 3-kinase tor2 [Rhizoctonia solani AG-1 IA]|uniref:Serine/threonine-protein kinase TOR n=1 Tax=Thanatephorus cucumeris (strain AG1-IA) TaxID=983506 RepID=L8WHZ0_THACA|nr:phosphatidylinositol 3-kinase tor2 [Rhizoctonia solani AG-1 IA]